jgi:2-polyprenyl-3-methyl-5-hydroxy-6-metoxy-1,4-benzoquinol methylase
MMHLSHSSTRADAGLAARDLLTCTICASPEIDSAFTSAGYAIARCSSCGHLFVSQNVEDEILDQAYREKYYAAADAGPSAGYADYLGNMERRMEGFRSRLHDILRYTGSSGTLLDFGCAVGLFVKVANDEGWHAVGYERSRWAADYGRRVFGVDIKLASDEADPFSEASFDVITMWDVIEHVQHPRSIMSLVRKWLKEGGIVALNTVNASSLGARLAGTRWRHFAPPHHLQFFSRRSLIRLLRDAGFRILHVSANGTCFEGRNSPVLAALRRLDDLVCHWRLRPIVTALGLLDEIEVVAVKT